MPQTTNANAGASVVNLPWSGAVEQWINPLTYWFSPQVTVNYQGVGPIERKVISEVAGYGQQLDALIGAVLELARETGQAGGPAVAALDKLSAKIEQAKRAARSGEAAATDDPAAEDPAAAAKAALERLRADDPKALAELIAQFR